MKLTFRILASTLLTVAIVTGGFTFQQLRHERARLSEEINSRAVMVASSLQALVEPLLRPRQTADLVQVMDRFS